jgi:hypothetical protein
LARAFLAVGFFTAAFLELDLGLLATLVAIPKTSAGG